MAITKPAEKALKIESGIPRDVDEYTKAADEMKVGDSVLLPDAKEASRLCRALEKKHGAGSHTFRTVDGGVRVWRDERPVRTRKAKAAVSNA